MSISSSSMVLSSVYDQPQVEQALAKEQFHSIYQEKNGQSLFDRVIDIAPKSSDPMYARIQSLFVALITINARVKETTINSPKFKELWVNFLKNGMGHRVDKIYHIVAQYANCEDSVLSPFLNQYGLNTETFFKVDQLNEVHIYDMIADYMNLYTELTF